MNRAIEEMVICILSYAKLPKSLWAESILTAVDLINLSWSASLDGDIPERVWTEEDVSYKHFRVFGCRVYVHFLKDERSKLDVKAKEWIFLGYMYEEFRYRLWDPVVRKLIKSSDVVFHEDQILGDIEKSDESQLSSKIPIIPNSVSLLVLHDDHVGN